MVAGDVMLLDDGLVQLQVTAVEGERISHRANDARVQS